MSSYSKLCTIVYWLALVTWVSVLVTVAVAATATFTVLGDLDLTVHGYTLPEPTDHGRLAAGKVMDPVFALVDIVQIFAAGLVLITLALQLLVFGLPRRSPANILRGACLVAATVLLGVRVLALTPTMNRELRAYWSASETGDVAAARVHRDAFNEKHPTASKLFSVTLLLLLPAVAASAVALGPTMRSIR